MIKQLFIAITFLLLSACDAYEDMSSMFEKQQSVQEYIKHKNGYTAQVGFNINNGVLTQVTVYFKSVEVKQESVAKLEEIALTAVAKSFKLIPRTLNVAIQTTPDEAIYKRLQNTKPGDKPPSKVNAGRKSNI